MRDRFILAIHLPVTFVTLLQSGGVRAVGAESVLLKHQLRLPRGIVFHARRSTDIDCVSKWFALV
jgi:hypothetical protein